MNIYAHTCTHTGASPLILLQLNKSLHFAATYDQEANNKEMKEKAQAGIHSEGH